ncbi:hypothetical protein BX600DRAFT_177903 [Xylariales sp. PMI_506]|nr:hypothetical protein BX600DRAFT_177903 [Xylariales sp. PMI_506]
MPWFQHFTSLKFIVNVCPSFLTDPSSELMMGSCLVVGCCVSSFTHRRQDKDTFQTEVFTCVIFWAAMVGKGVGASFDLITLGLVPLALSLAMLLSFAGHEFGRWLAKRPKRPVPCTYECKS